MNENNLETKPQTIQAINLGDAYEKNGIYEFKFSVKKVCDTLNQSFKIFRTLSPDGVKFLQIIDNIVEDLTIEQVHSLISNYIKNNIFREAFVNKDGSKTVENITDEINSQWAQDFNKNCNKNYYSYIEIIEINYLKDKVNIFYNFYKNGFIEITNKSKTFKDYKDLPGYIKKSQISKYDFKTNDNDIDKSETQTFFELISQKKDGSEEATLRNLKWATGYLCHNWHGNLMIVLSDSKIGVNLSEANGRTGKDIYGKILGTIVPRAIVDGKTFKIDNKHRYSKVDEDDKIIGIEDASLGFRPEWLFNDISNGITIDRKNRQEILVDGEHRPKLMISLNHAFSGEGQSYDARQLVIELGEFFNGSKCTPQSHFGHLLITEWTPNEFNLNYNFLHNCIFEYLQNPNKPKQVTPTYDRKRSQVAAGDSMYEHYDAANLARIIYLSTISEGLYLMPEFLELQRNKIIGQKDTFNIFSRRLVSIMKNNNVILGVPKRITNIDGRVSGQVFKICPTTNIDILKEYNKLVPDENKISKKEINEYEDKLIKDYNATSKTQIEEWMK